MKEQMEFGMNKKVEPIFIISLPRSGSTILQKNLALNPQIATTGETWLMLPFIYALKKDGIIAKYSHLIGHKGLTDTINYLPNKEEDYYRSLSLFAKSIYSKLSDSPDNDFFLDKTPRYYNIIEELHKVFPQAKFIFLIRNPLSIYSSTLNFSRNNYFHKLYNMYNDLYDGPALLAKGYELVKDKSMLLTYQDLINSPKKSLNAIYDYLNIPNNSVDKNFLFRGVLGDTKALKSKGAVIDDKSLNKWKNSFNTPVRKKIIKKYISNLDQGYLDLADLNKTDLIKEIDSIKTIYKWILRDLVDWLMLKLILRFKLHLLFSKSLKYFRSSYYE